MAVNALLHSNKPQQSSSSGLGGIASSLLGGSHSNSHSGGNSGSSSLVGSLAGSLLGGNKPYNQPQQQQQSSSNHSSSGMLGSLFGGHSSVSKAYRIHAQGIDLFAVQSARVRLLVYGLFKQRLQWSSSTDSIPAWRYTSRPI